MNRPQRTKKPRIWEVDFFRGFAIIMVIWDHLMVDFYMFKWLWASTGVQWLADMGQFGADYIGSNLRLFWRPVFLFIFFFSSGLSTAFSKNNLIRGLKLAVVAAVVSLLTYLITKYTGDDLFILFGVLHCIAVIILIYTILSFAVDAAIRLILKFAKKEYSKRLSALIVGLVCLALSFIFIWIHNRFNTSIYAGDFQTTYIQTDKEWLGLFFNVYSWATADYFPLFPYIAFFFFGAGLAPVLYSKRKSLLPSLDGKWHLPFTAAGRHSLIIYLACQVVLFALIALVTYIATGLFIF